MKTRSTTLGTVIKLSAVILLTLYSAHNGYAQRTMRDQNLLTISVQTPCTGARDFGASVSYGRYLLDSYWRTCVSAIPRGIQLSTGDRMDLLGIRAGADYMYRIAATRSRSFNLYGGGGAFIGYEIYDPFTRLAPNINTGLKDGAFIYGINASIEAEVFIARRIALTVACATPLTFGSVTRWIRINATAGIRINI